MLDGIINSGIKAATIQNCYSIGNMKSRCVSGIVGNLNSADVFNCYSIGKIESSYCGGIIIGMNYGGHMVHCFGRKGDFSALSSYNNKGDIYGHGNKAIIGEKCEISEDEYLKSREFINELNNLITAGKSGEEEGTIKQEKQNVWMYDENDINNGYPIFNWQ